MTAIHSAILSLGHMEEELSTACRAAADALEILSNLQSGFTRNVIPRINSSTAVSVSQANSGERQVNDEKLQANEVPFNPRRRQPRAVLFKLGLPLSSLVSALSAYISKTAQWNIFLLKSFRKQDEMQLLAKF